MNTKASILLTVALACTNTDAFTIESSSRRDALRQLASGGGAVVIASVFAIGASPLPALATVPACPPGSQNCIRTMWTVPSAAGRNDDVAGSLGDFECVPPGRTGRRGQGRMEDRGGGFEIYRPKSHRVRFGHWQLCPVLQRRKVLCG